MSKRGPVRSLLARSLQSEGRTYNKRIRESLRKCTHMEETSAEVRLRVTAGLPHAHRQEAAGRDDTSTESRTKKEEPAGVRGRALRPTRAEQASLAGSARVEEAGRGGGRGDRRGWQPCGGRQRGSWSKGALTATESVALVREFGKPRSDVRDTRAGVGGAGDKRGPTAGQAKPTDWPRRGQSGGQSGDSQGDRQAGPAC